MSDTCATRLPDYPSPRRLSPRRLRACHPSSCRLGARRLSPNHPSSHQLGYTGAALGIDSSSDDFGVLSSRSA
jgi:hypothetical protein